MNRLHSAISVAARRHCPILHVRVSPRGVTRVRRVRIGGARAGSVRLFALLLALLFQITTPFLPGSGETARAQSEGLLGVGKLDSPPPSDELNAKIARLEKQNPLEGTNYRAQYDLANAYQEAGLDAEAEARYRRALEINPGFVEAKVNLGVLLTDLARYEEAVELFEEALAADPEDCNARSNLGNAYYSMSRFPDAMYEYQRAVEIDPKCYPALFNIAVAFADAGIFREAVKWWTRVAEVAPGTDAGRQARDNIELLRPFVESPIPAPRATGN